MSEQEIIKILALISSLIVAIVGHEIMHGYVAWKNGDSTAKDRNRLSMNPIVHVDPVGSIVVPAMLYFSGAPFLFGWAKPVPVNMNTVIKNGGYNGAIAVDLAGIAFNFGMAILSAMLIHNYFDAKPTDLTMLFVFYFLIHNVIYNVVLGVFNLWPIPPLDGSNALAHLGLKMGTASIYNMMQKVGKYGMFILIAIIATPVGNYIFEPARKLIMYLLTA